MDPLSITASSVAFATAAIQTYKQISQLLNAQHEVQEYISDVQQTRRFLQVLHKQLEVQSVRSAFPIFDQEPVDGLCHALRDTQTKLELLSSIATKVTKSVTSTSGVEKQKVKKTAWWRNKSQLDRLHSDLAKCCQKLDRYSAITNLSGIHQTIHSLDEFRREQINQGLLLTNSSHQIEVMVSNLANLVRLQQHAYFFSNEIRNNNIIFNPAPQVLESSSSSPLLPGLVHPSSTQYHGAQESGTQANIQWDNMPSSPITTGPPVDHLRLLVGRRCSIWCSCACHRTYKLQIPDFIAPVVGSLSVRSTVLPGMRVHCTETLCRRQTRLILRALYRFPYWMLSRGLQIAIKYSLMNGPEFGLSAPRIVPYGAQSFHFAETGQLEQLRNMFLDGAASPFDVRMSDGWTLAHVAINTRDTLLLQFLLNSGADPDLDDTWGMSAVCFAWEKIFVEGLSPTTRTISWPTLFRNNDYLESQALPPLSKVVLGFNGADLVNQLKLSTAQINQQDANGFTALAWAAARGDQTAVKSLLDFGADPNISNIRGRPPLILATDNGEHAAPEILRLLLQHGSQVDHQCLRGQTALMATGRGQQGQACIEVLAEFGADLDKRSKFGDTALSMATWYGQESAVRQLLKSGANATICDDRGKAPFIGAVQNNHHEVLRALIRNKVVCKTHDEQGATIWHWAARYADIETIELLSQGVAEGLFACWGEFDSREQDPEDVFKDRKVMKLATRDLEVAFERLARLNEPFYEAEEYLLNDIV